jgi:hypothetical protein
VLEMGTAQSEPRRQRLRGPLLRDDRLTGVDMRTRQGRRFRAILRSVVAEFCEAVRLANVLARRERELRGTARPMADSTPDLASYLAQRHGEAGE